MTYFRLVKNFKAKLLILLLFFACSEACLAEQPANLVVGSPIRGEGVEGDLTLLANSVLVPEGAMWNSSGAVVFKGIRSYILIDLEASKTIKYILLQAGHDDEYIVESSNNLYQWTELWKTPSVLTGIGLPDMGLRTRTAVLPYSTTARFLRVRAINAGGSGDFSFSVSRLQVYTSVPDEWPPELDYSIPNSRPPLFPWVDIVVDGTLKIFLATIILILMTWTMVSVSRPEDHLQKRIRRILLASAIFVSCIAWPNFLNFQFISYYHVHEFYHYFVGSKYTKELGYNRLYDCTALADIEDGLFQEVSSRRMRDLRNNMVVSSYGIITDPDRCLSYFEQSRWKEFKEDVRWFRERFFRKHMWDETQLDHGFNASPVWMIAGTTLSNLVPLSDAYITFLSFLDICLLVLLGIILYRSFGLEATVIAVSFFCLNSIAHYRYTGGSFLRYDWFFLLALGIFALRKKQEKLAGFALAYASLLRIFPGFVLVGISLKALIELVSSRSLKPLRNYKDLVLGVVLAFVVLIPLSLVVSGQDSDWSEFIQNSEKHIKAGAANYMGLKRVIDQNVDIGTRLLPSFGQDEDLSLAEKYKLTTEQNKKIIFFVFAALFVCYFGYAVRRESLWVTAVLSIGLIPVLSVISNYYYIVFSLFGLLWCVRPAAAYSLCFLSWASWICVWLFKTHRSEYMSLSVLILLFTVVLIGLIAIRRRS